MADDDPVIVFDEDGARRIADAVSYVEHRSKNDLPSGAPKVGGSPVQNWCLVTSVTLVNGFYPAKLQALDPATGVGGTWNDVSPAVSCLLIHPNGTALTNATRYLGRLAGSYNDGSTTRAVYVVVGGC